MLERIARVRPHWFDQAACTQPVRRSLPEHVAEFFPATRSSSAVAKRICADCPVRQDCYEYALARPELAGIWGGFGQRHRVAERAKRAAA